MNALSRKLETREQRKHRFDRECVAAVYRRKRAQAGHGFKFQPPERLRR